MVNYNELKTGDKIRSLSFSADKNIYTITKVCGNGMVDLSWGEGDHLDGYAINITDWEKSWELVEIDWEKRIGGKSL